MDWLGFTGRGAMLLFEEIPLDPKGRSRLLLEIEQWILHYEVSEKLEGEGAVPPLFSVKLSYLCRELGKRRHLLISMSAEE